MGFWIAALVLGALVSLLLAMSLLRRPQGSQNAAQSDVLIYKDQLADLDRDKVRGLIAPEEAERARLEISRRILEADKAAQAAGASSTPHGGISRVFAIAIALVILGGGSALYIYLGAPGYPDLPLSSRIAAAAEMRAERPDQATAETGVERREVEANPDHVALIERLRTELERRPDDLQGHTLLVDNEARLGNLIAAHRAQANVLRIKGDSATADDYAKYADLLILAAGGYVSPEAEQALTRALNLDPTNGTARYYSGLLFAQTGRPDLAFRFWSALLDDSPPDAPWVPAIEARIADTAMRAGVNYSPPTPGPDAGAVAAAEDMNPEERAEMIRGMVETLADRLATDGGTPDEWAQLIGALSVLGETDRAAAILEEARTVFADNPDALARIEASANQAGIAE
ncbi:c-type cytochrome biogenesis protein CcmI [Aliiroseovarius sp. YM-037]|uniref:c-type cytochrome biogenesis protein CcmI n=1 Tax=Aliiroseovarius sp. YM-037 TaxID=3341728 RepID=UPI003A80099F